MLQDPKTAWRFTLAREIVEHRAIKFEDFIEAYYKTIANLSLQGPTEASEDGSISSRLAEFHK